MAKQAVSLGANMEASIEGSKLTIVIDLAQNVGPSKTGKSTNIATTSGNTNVVYGGKVVKLGINCYIPN